MSIFPILFGCIGAAHLGQSDGVPVGRIPLNAPFGTTDYTEIPAIYLRALQVRIGELADEYEQKATA